MSLLIDKLDPRRAGDPKADEATRDFLDARMKVFEVTNVCDLVGRTHWLEKDEGEYRIDFSKFPNVAPAFRSYWLEWVVPKKYSTFGSQPIDRLGCWVVIDDETDDDEWSISLGIWAGLHKREPWPVGHGQLKIDRRTGDVRREAKAVHVDYRGFEYLDKRRRPPVELSKKEQRELRQEIAACTDPAAKLALANEQLAEAKERIQEANRDLQEHWTKWLRIMALPTILMTHSLIGCKNVDQEVHQRPAKIIKARERRGKPGAVRFTTLAIRPMGGSHGDDRSAVGDGQMALHLVRGHFKTFTTERPLFGKHVGTYWWSPNARGNERNGTVVKDYEVAL